MSTVLAYDELLRIIKDVRQTNEAVLDDLMCGFGVLLTSIYPYQLHINTRALLIHDKTRLCKIQIDRIRGIFMVIKTFIS